VIADGNDTSIMYSKAGRQLELYQLYLDKGVLLPGFYLGVGGIMIWAVRHHLEVNVHDPEYDLYDYYSIGLLEPEAKGSKSGKAFLREREFRTLLKVVPGCPLEAMKG
jgi:hypothetical protein